MVGEGRVESALRGKGADLTCRRLQWLESYSIRAVHAVPLRIAAVARRIVFETLNYLAPHRQLGGFCIGLDTIAKGSSHCSNPILERAQAVDPYKGSNHCLNPIHHTAQPKQSVVATQLRALLTVFRCIAPHRLLTRSTTIRAAPSGSLAEGAKVAPTGREEAGSDQQTYATGA